MNVVYGTWQALQTDASLVRQQVFIEEQKIPPQEEWDIADQTAIHFVVYQAEQVIATARLVDQNKIGRVAVLKPYRNLGVGTFLLQFIIDYAQQQQRSYLQLSAQIQALSFYENLGFCAEGETYLDCNIPHQTMKRYF